MLQMVVWCTDNYEKDQRISQLHGQSLISLVPSTFNRMLKLSSPTMIFVGHYNCLLIKTIKCHINCQPREVYLFQRQSHTVYAQSQKKSKVVVKVTLITPCLEQTEVLP
jgi:hypothetical protein